MLEKIAVGKEIKMHEVVIHLVINNLIYLIAVGCIFKSTY